MKSNRGLAGAVLLFLIVPGFAAAQALPNLTLLRVQYNTRKMTAPPQGELKAQIEALDKQIAEAALLGHNGELRRLFAKGMTLLAGKSWTDELDFATSLVLRTDASSPTRRSRLRSDSSKSTARRSLCSAGFPREWRFARAAARPDRRQPRRNQWSRASARSKGSAAISASRRFRSRPICRASQMGPTS
jgi:hypothetical protein